jgi:hypothetical protein
MPVILRPVNPAPRPTYRPTVYGYVGAFECHYSNTKLAGFVALDCFMILAALACTRLGSPGGVVAGWAGVAFFGSALPLIVMMAARRGPMLVMDARGLDYRELPIGIVPWDDVAEVGVAEVESQRFLCVGLRDEAPYLARLGVVHRARARTRRAMGFPLVSIGFAAADKTLEDAMRAAQAFVAAKAGK